MAYFDINDCNNCPNVSRCLVKCGKKTRKIIISNKKIRHDSLLLKFKNNEYLEKCKLRPAIEGTVWQFSHYIRNGKVRFRGFINIRQRMILRAIGINFKRLNKAFSTFVYFLEIYLKNLRFFLFYKKICFFSPQKN